MAINKLGRYEILSELGQGAMGVVYKAIDPLIERTVAIKTIKLDLSAQDLANFEERFYREAKSAGRLNHPNIVTIYDVGKTDNVAYMAMEFMEGRLLKDVLDAHTAFSIDQIVDIVAKIAGGLGYAHENGVVHRDVKPANIMLVRGNSVKIMDFGIAQMPGGVRTLAEAAWGSPKYMAPEQVSGTAVDGRSDIFSLGVILYEMLTGESPFDGDNINTILYRIVHETPVPPKSLAPRVPEVFNRIIAKAMAKQPEERYQNAEAMARDLRSYNTGSLSHPVTASAPEPAPSVRRPSVGEATIILDPTTLRSERDSQPAGAATYNAVAPVLNNKKTAIFALIALGMIILVFIVYGKKTTFATNPGFPVKSAAPHSGILAGGANVIPTSQPVSVSARTAAAQNTEAQHPEKAIWPNVIDSKTDNAKAKETATLIFAVFPWGEIYIDGKIAGITPPLKRLTIPAGKHKIEIRNLNFPRYSKIAVLKAGSSKYIRYTFQ